jgi:hypothetical protein
MHLSTDKWKLTAKNLGGHRFSDAAAHKVHTGSGEYKTMMAATEQYGLLSGAPILQGVSLVGGFNGR